MDEWLTRHGQANMIRSGLAVVFATDVNATAELHPPGKFLLRTPDIRSSCLVHFRILGQSLPRIRQERPAVRDLMSRILSYNGQLCIQVVFAFVR